MCTSGASRWLQGCFAKPLGSCLLGTPIVRPLLPQTFWSPRGRWPYLHPWLGRAAYLGGWALPSEFSVLVEWRESGTEAACGRKKHLAYPPGVWLRMPEGLAMPYAPSSTIGSSFTATLRREGTSHGISPQSSTKQNRPAVRYRSGQGVFLRSSPSSGPIHGPFHVPSKISAGVLTR
jgi:hypothetical protein